MATPDPESDRLLRARAAWTNDGAVRPPFAHETGPDEESVWDYPRPPALVSDARPVEVGALEDPLVVTTQAVRVLETASPPTFYLPMADTAVERLVVTSGSSFCEWKGAARYWALATEPSTPIAWDYPDPFESFAAIRDHLAFYPGRIECRVGDEVVRSQAGGFYGGWITDEIVGPFKGDPGTSGW